jgi:carboxypeptidase C (cathepsin A)
MLKSALMTLVAVQASAAPTADSVPSLRVHGAPPTAMYSGYLDAKGTTEHPGCATTEAECKLHYWFAAAESDPANKPVVLWMAGGGPGSSGGPGILQENASLLISTGGLVQNPYSWTKAANLVILEGPTGVGFSYCSTQKAGGACKNIDKLTAAAARAAMCDLFATKFPELQRNKFFITGDFFAGVHVPALAKELQDNAKGQVNFKGRPSSIITGVVSRADLERAALGTAMRARGKVSSGQQQEQFEQPPQEQQQQRGVREKKEEQEQEQKEQEQKEQGQGHQEHRDGNDAKGTSHGVKGDSSDVKDDSTGVKSDYSAKDDGNDAKGDSHDANGISIFISNGMKDDAGGAEIEIDSSNGEHQEREQQRQQRQGAAEAKKHAGMLLSTLNNTSTHSDEL